VVAASGAASGAFTGAVVCCSAAVAGAVIRCSAVVAGAVALRGFTASCFGLGGAATVSVAPAPPLAGDLAAEDCGPQATEHPAAGRAGAAAAQH
jgi:hypothetical protein